MPNPRINGEHADSISQSFCLPNYKNGSLVNLMSSIAGAFQSNLDANTALSLLPSSQISDANNVVLFIIDGLGYQYLMQNGDASFLRRHLKSKMTSVFPSTTATAITSIMTGLSPQAHGIAGWHTYYKEADAILAPLPFKVRANNSSRSQILPQNIFNQNTYFDSLGVKSYVFTPEKLIKSPYSIAMSGSAERMPYQNMRDLIDQVLKLIKQPQRKYIYAYWPEFDSIAHQYGVASEQTKQHFFEIDGMFQRFFQIAAGSDSAVIISADHGFIDTSADEVIHIEDHPDLAHYLIMPLSGEPRAAYCYVKPQHKIDFKAYVKSNLQNVCTAYKSEQLIQQGYFGKGLMHPKFADRIGDYTLIMKEQYVITDQLPGEKPFNMVGIHGGVSAAEMEIPFIFSRL